MFQDELERDARWAEAILNYYRVPWPEVAFPNDPKAGSCIAKLEIFTQTWNDFTVIKRDATSSGRSKWWPFARVDHQLEVRLYPWNPSQVFEQILALATYVYLLRSKVLAKPCFILNYIWCISIIDLPPWKHLLYLIKTTKSISVKHSSSYYYLGKPMRTSPCQHPLIPAHLKALLLPNPDSIFQPSQPMNHILRL